MTADGGDGGLDAFALRVEDATSERNTTQATRNYQNCARVYGSRSPAALGCLLALAREAWGVVVVIAAVWQRPDGWNAEIRCFMVEGADVPGEFGTEAEALVAALEAAP